MKEKGYFEALLIFLILSAMVLLGMSFASYSVEPEEIEDIFVFLSIPLLIIWIAYSLLVPKESIIPILFLATVVALTFASWFVSTEISAVLWAMVLPMVLTIILHKMYTSWLERLEQKIIS